MKMHLFLLTLIAFCQVISCSFSDHDLILSKFMGGPKKELFKVYHSIFSKEYDLNTELGLKRYKAFKDNLKFIKAENAKNKEYELGLNQFSDLTNEEYRQTLNLNLQSYESSFLGGKNFESSQNFKAGEVIVDHRQYMGAIKNQGGCGSCWSFGAIGAVEGNYAKKFGTKLVLSEQHLVDCDTNNKGCSGGWPTYAFDFIKNKGSFDDSEYPYTSGRNGVRTQCKQTSTSKVYKLVSNQKYCQECKYSDWQALIKEGPINIAVDAGSRDFQSYKSGIINPSGTSNANHAVIAVALQTDTQGDYFIVRNSWGSTWGDKGHISIRVNAYTNSIQGTNYAWLPILSKTDPPSPVPPTPVGDCPVLYKDINYSGESLKLCSSDVDLNKSGWAGVAQSMRIGKANQVEFFKEANCVGNSGISAVLKADNPNFSANSDGFVARLLRTAKSVSLSAESPPQNCIWVFADCCYLGGKQEICKDLADFGSIGFDNRVSSIRLGSGVGATFYFNANFVGIAYGVGSDIACFDGDSKIMNDNASSVKIYRKTN
jgi:hypothetical protein